MSDVELIRYLRAVANYGTCLTANDKEALALAVVSGRVRYCPHGRPVSVKLTKTELDKQFKRIV